MDTRIPLSDLIPLGQARRELIPCNAKGKPISKATAWRWINHGLKIADGSRVKLKAYMLGGRPFVTRADVEHFVFELSQDKKVAEQVPEFPKCAQGREASE